MQGKTQLSKALLQDTLDARVTEALVARTMLTDAGKQLAVGAADIEAKLKKIPAADKGDSQ